jgi:serine/threonine protein kinase/tetratricopeptide (TPR) repeat protein
MPNDDDSFLDLAFDRAVARIEDGEPVDVADLLEDREELRGAVAEVVRLAREVAVGLVEALPSLPGYSILQELGHGGMGAVYLARQERLGGRLVALKVLPPAAALSVRARERFHREASAVARIRHPNVVAVHDVIEASGIHAYAMEWIDGLSLAQLLETLERSEREPSLTDVRSCLGSPTGALEDAPSYVIFACRIALKIARALGEVHRAGLLHRDVKPSNILLRRDGTPLLADFGLARDAESEASLSGHFAGTPAYAAPEQLRGSPVDARTDVYGLGVTLYHAIARRAPFRGPSTASVLEQIETGAAAPLRRVAPRSPSDLQTIVAKAMDPEPSRRYATADDLADELERLLALEPIHARPAGFATRTLAFVRRNRRTFGTAVAASSLTLGLTIGLAVWWLLVPRWRERDVAEARLALFDPGQNQEIFTAGFWNERSAGARPRPALTDSGFAVSLACYDAALRLPGNDRSVHVERDVVGLARDIASSRGSVAAVGPDLPLTRSVAERWIEARQAPSLEPERLRFASADDLRALGLLSFLLGDVDAVVAAWSRLDLLQDPDPLVEAALGQIYLVLDKPALAYPRLRNAAAAFPDVGFLVVCLADAALRCGDFPKAERLVASARHMQRLDDVRGLERVEADLAAASGDADRARRLYEYVARHNDFSYFHYGEFLASQGEDEEALHCFLEVLSKVPFGEKPNRALVLVADRWWENQNDAERFAWVRGALENASTSSGTLRSLLTAYQRSLVLISKIDTSGPVPAASRAGRTSLRELAERMAPTDEVRWATLRACPPLLKDWQAAGWLSAMRSP